MFTPTVSAKNGRVAPSGTDNPRSYNTCDVHRGASRRVNRADPVMT